jgi:hypothetical protein
VNPAYNATHLNYVATGVVGAVAPSAPAGLTATAGPIGTRRIDLAWSAATDNFGVVAYRMTSTLGPHAPIFSPSPF